MHGELLALCIQAILALEAVGKSRFDPRESCLLLDFSCSLEVSGSVVVSL